MKPLYKPYDNGVIPFDRAFNQKQLDEVTKGVLDDARAGGYTELMETYKWLKLCLRYTNDTLENYDKGIDMTGGFISKLDSAYHTEKLHFNEKRVRLNKAIEICGDHLPFK